MLQHCELVFEAAKLLCQSSSLHLQAFKDFLAFTILPGECFDLLLVFFEFSILIPETVFEIALCIFEGETLSPEFLVFLSGLLDYFLVVLELLSHFLFVDLEDRA